MGDFQVFFTSIPAGTSLDEIKSMFSQVGSVKNARFGREEKYGFVSYYNQKDAEKAIATLNKKEPLNLRVDWPRKSDGSSSAGGGGYNNNNNNHQQNSSRSYSNRDDRNEDSFFFNENVSKPQSQTQNNSFFGGSANTHYKNGTKSDDLTDTGVETATGSDNELKITEILNYLIRVRDQTFIEYQNRMAREYVRKNFASLQAVNESFNLISNNLEMLTIGGNGKKATMTTPTATPTSTQNGFKEPKWSAPSSSGFRANGTNDGNSSSRDTSSKREYSSYDKNNQNPLQRSVSGSSTSMFNGKRSKPIDERESWDNMSTKKVPSVVPEMSAPLNNGSEWEDETPAPSSLATTATTSLNKSQYTEILKSFSEFSAKEADPVSKKIETIEKSPKATPVSTTTTKTLEQDLETQSIPPPLIEIGESKIVAEPIEEKYSDVTDCPVKKSVCDFPAETEITTKEPKGVTQRKFAKLAVDFVRVKTTVVESQQTGHIILADSIPKIEQIENSLMKLKPEPDFVPKIGQICAYCESETKRYRVQITKVGAMIQAKMIDNGRIINTESYESFIDMTNSEFYEHPCEAIKIEIRNIFKLTENLEFEAKYCFENSELNLIVIDARYLEEKKSQPKPKIKSFIHKDSIVSKGYIEMYSKLSDNEVIASCVVDELQDKLTEIENDALVNLKEGYDPQINDICYGLHPNGSEWLRCKVLKKKPDGTYLMSLLDYGLTDICSQVRPISLPIFDIPHFSVLIEVSNTSDYENKTYYFEVIRKFADSFHVTFADETGSKTDETFVMKPFHADTAYDNLQ